MRLKKQDIVKVDDDTWLRGSSTGGRIMYPGLGLTKARMKVINTAIKRLGKGYWRRLGDLQPGYGNGNKGKALFLKWPQGMSCIIMELIGPWVTIPR